MDILKRALVSFVFLISFVQAGLCQFYEYGQDAGSLRWNHFRTSHCRIIYPRGIDSVAVAFAAKLEYFYPYQGEVMNHYHRPIPVIIHNEASFSNGVFVWAPKRLEIFTNPDPNGYAEDWLNQLALHEGRHAFQIDKLDRGFARVLSVLGGEQVVGAMAGFLPYWYLEGDAVDAETRFSESGRGRQPEFEMEIKAQLLEEKKVYSYSKATLGSYKDHVPNHYQMGYLMVRYGRIMHGNKLWNDFQQKVATRPYLLVPTYLAMKQNQAGSKTSLYRNALEYYRQHWIKQGTWRLTNDFHQWNRDPGRFYTSYNFPGYISNSLVITCKTGINQIPEFVLLGKNGEEKRVYRPGILNSGRISSFGDMVAWDEFVPDERWSNRNYSVIKTLNIGTGQVRNLGRKTRYYAPSFSKDGKRIAAVEQDERYRFSLVVLDLEGRVRHQIPSPENCFIQHPAWMERDSAIVVTMTNSEGKFLVAYSFSGKRWVQLFHSGFDNISYPVVSRERIFFNGTFTGIDNIFCLDLRDNRVYQVTSSRFGGFQPQISPDGTSIILADYSAWGYNVKSLDLEYGLWKPLEEVRDHTEQINYEPTEKEKNIVEGAILPDHNRYDIKPYRKVLHPFKFHSWLPLYFDYLNPGLAFSPEDLPASPGFSLLSQNHLTTVVSQFGYEYREGYHYLHSGLQMKGRYPAMNLSAHYGGLPRILNPVQNDSLILKPDNLEFNAEVYIPWRLNTGKFITFLQPLIDYTYRTDYQYYDNEGIYLPGAHYMRYNLFASSYLRMGRLDILPRAGFNASASYSHSPFNHQVYGSEVLGSLSAYLPGILRHHAIKINLSYYAQNPVNRSKPNFRYIIAPPRGMDVVYGINLRKWTLDYVFPILYPDLNIEGWFYLTRIRGALWADRMTGTDVIVLEPNPHYEDLTYKTYGIELVTDFHLFRLAFPLTVGSRICYLPDKNDFTFEWIYSVDIN
ncbi:MAG: hypothetical protein JXR52_02245 [Bacteroidales bacterium]|nr:hypothetical protein [Bacteroidales bacterium]MBN2697621.1 hypothetical protein [Bacteroidales bacterium]